MFALMAHSALGQTTSFTYQGRLSDGNALANGTYDIQFKLFDALTSGAQVGSSVTNAAVSVANGIFTVGLDFGSSSFPGADRFLEIAVRPAGSVNPYTVLSPRQPFTSTPYAIQALKAATADTLSSACVGCVLTVTGGNSAFQNSDTFAGFGAGASTTPSATPNGNLNSFFGASAGHTNTTGGENTFFGADAGYWNLTGQGNSFFGDFAGNLNSAGNNNSFFGSGAGYSNTGFGNSFFGQQSGNSNSSGTNNSFLGIQAGIGSTQGNNNTFLGALAGGANTVGGNNTLVGSGANVGANNLTNATAIGANSGVSQSNSLVLGSINGVNSATSDTRVGIGTTSPGYPLTVSSTTAGYSAFITNSGDGNNALYASSNGGIGVYGTTPSYVGVWGDGGTGIGLRGTAASGWGLVAACTTCSSGGAAWFRGGNVLVDNSMTVSGSMTASGVTANGNLTAAGNVGIGTTTPAAKLDVENSSGTDSLYVHNTSGYAIHARSETNYAGYFEGYTYFANLVFLPVLGAAGVNHLCLNASNQIGGCSSSLRYKTGVAPFADGLDLINRLRPIQFEWKDGGTHDIGLAAEEVERVEPRLTFRNNAGQIEGVKYDRLTAVFINAFKEQQEQIKRQQSQIDGLKELVCLDHPQAAVCK
jgi:hypothetical protein